MLRTFKTSVLTLAFIGYGGVAYLAAVHGAAVPAPDATAPAAGGPTYDEGLGSPGAPEDDDIPF